MKEACPICESTSADVTTLSNPADRQVGCPACGNFELVGFNRIQRKLLDKDHLRPLISHHIRLMQRRDEWPCLTPDYCDRIILETTLPSPPEQGDNLVRLIGDELRHNDPSSTIDVGNPSIPSKIGAFGNFGVHYAVGELEKTNLVVRDPRHKEKCNLTFSGWQRYAELQRSHSEGQIAFMAMPFNDEILDRVFREQFKPAIDQCGFELRRVDEAPQAGLIDARMEVEIRKSRFLLAELSDGNRGVYWEAGFAEGLGKPVIYTCEASAAEHIHFDANHRHTVIWRHDEMARAIEEIKITVRATLPGEAVLSDPTM